MPNGKPDLLSIKSNKARLDKLSIHHYHSAKINAVAG